MHKRIIGTLLMALSLALTSCQTQKEEQKTYTYDRSYFNGICALSGEFNNGVDYALTNDWTASKVKALKAKSSRLWIAMSGLFTVGENDDLTVNQKYYLVMKDHVDKLKDTSTLLTFHPSFCSISTTIRRRRRLSAPSYFLSVSGKCFPISPLPAAPSNASISACNATSASLCPSSPFV